MGSFKCTWMKFLVSLKFGWVSLLRRRTRCNNTAVESSSIGDAFGCSLRFGWVGLQRSRARCSRWKWRWGWLPCTSLSSAAMHQCTSSSSTAMHQYCHAPVLPCNSAPVPAVLPLHQNCHAPTSLLLLHLCHCTDSPHPLCIHLFYFYNALYGASAMLHPFYCTLLLCARLHHFPTAASTLPLALDGNTALSTLWH